MNIIIDKLPTEVNGLKIETNFRNFILFEELVADSNIPLQKKAEKICELFFYGQNLSDFTFEEIINRIIYIYSCGKYETSAEVTTNKSYTARKKIYDFEEDAEYIYSAFLEQYNIDLNAIEYMHWWKFKALFNSLGEHTLFSKILSYRSIDLSKIKDKERKAYYKQMKKTYALRDNRTEEEKEQDLAEAFL